MDWLDLQRLATALVMPLSPGVLLGIIGLALVWRARWRLVSVTSAWHLRRAVALSEQEGFAVQPVSSDYRSFPNCRGLQCWVPSAGALEDGGLALKEVLGYAVQVRAWPGSRLPGRDDG